MHYSLSPQPRRQFVNPTKGDSEPAEGADFLASETQDEVAIDVAPEG